ncbi:MAG: type II secretion system F family protein [Oxalobacteraceae bacterium]|jgi:tight adherence protein C|nr:type II secretion system F family protein [Oxalobacteraceae bacterium]MCX7215096.1 type II secretion system F family protein [Burkholderiales bacterium]
MTMQAILFLAVVFVSIASLSAGLVWWLTTSRLRQRLADTIAANIVVERSARWRERLASVIQPLAKLSLPTEGWEGSAIRIAFINAGWRQPSAPTIFFGIKTLLALSFPLIALTLSGEGLLASGVSRILFVLISASAVGYYLPNLFLRYKIAHRQRDLFESFPDALDLLIICVESGLGLDQAIAKVATEIEIKSKVLAQELQLVLMELRSGFSRETALRHLALRTGLEEIDLLVAMMVQADRFGTSMGDSLRVHADNLRTKRRQRAEEAAAKIAVKLLMPLIFMIFPTLMLVLVGPAMIQIYRVLLPSLGSN